MEDVKSSWRQVRMGQLYFSDKQQYGYFDARNVTRGKWHLDKEDKRINGYVKKKKQNTTYSVLICIWKAES